MNPRKTLACGMFLTIAALGLAAADDSGRSDFFYNGTDDPDASKVLSKALSRIDNVSDTEIVADQLVGFTYDSGIELRFTALCYMTTDMDRIDFQIALPVKDSIGRDDPNLQRFLVKLNEIYAGKFYMLDVPRSPVILVRSLYFQNHVRGELLASFLRAQAGVLRGVLAEHEADCRKFLR